MIFRERKNTKFGYMKKKTAILTAMLAAISPIIFAQNPISPEGVFIPDPSARVSPDGALLIYGSLDIKDGEYCSDRYHLLSTRDLVHWTLTEDIFRNEETLYAPDMYYSGGKYHLYYDCPGGTEWVATADSPVGPFTGKTRIEGPDQIDPCIFVDDDGQAYYFWGQFSAKGAKMNPDMKTIDLSTVTDGLVTEEEHGFHEGSFVFKRGEYYYFTYASVKRRNMPTCLSYAMSTSPLGPYEYKGEIIDNAGCDPGVWNNHGSVVEFGGKWYVLYHRSTHGDRFMRKACIEPITFREDGTIVEAEMTSQGASSPLDAYSRTDAFRACLLHGNTRIRLAEKGGCNEILSGLRGGDWAAFKYLDFGEKSPSSVTIRIRPQKGGRLGIATDQVYRGDFVSVDIPGGDGSKWIELSARIEDDITGKRALFLHFYGDDGDLFDIDWIRFDK